LSGAAVLAALLLFVWLLIPTEGDSALAKSKGPAGKSAKKAAAPKSGKPDKTPGYMKAAAMTGSKKGC
jgi:hypothetical protein